MKPLRSLTGASFTLVVACCSQFYARPAAADAKSCATAHATGQREAKAGHLRLASQLFTSCGSDDTCPSQLRAECSELLASVRAAMPTVIFSVLDEEKRDVSNVKVFSTDELVADGLDGRAVEIDPGKHRLRFLLPWGDVLSTDVLIREGEKARVVQVKIQGSEPPRADVAATPPPKPSAAPPPPPPPKSAPVAAWIASGVAVAGLGTGVAFAVVGSGKKSDLDSCKPNCPSDMKGTFDSAKRSFLIADISFGLAALSAGLATWLFLSHGSTEQEPPQNSGSRRTPSNTVTLGASSIPGGGTVLLSGSF